MKRFLIAAVPLASLLLGMNSSAAPTADIRSEIDAAYPQAETLYLDLHRHPELSGHEQRTAARLAAALRELHFEVTEHVGGTGVVGILKNGPGPVVMLRTELDALPVEEKTGLPFASTEKATDATGREVAVMHACGHDIHMAGWTATARIMASTRDRWRGTLILIGQPAEEDGDGATDMVQDGLFTRFPKPDYALAVHDDSRYPAGLIGYQLGAVMSAIDELTLIVHGRGGHGARPESTIDPIVIAARIVVTLQTIVARETSPLEPSVISVGSIHGGTRPNIIPDDVTMQLTVRSVSEANRQHLLAAIARIANGEAAAAGAPVAPTIRSDGHIPALINDAALAQRLSAALLRQLGPTRVKDTAPEMVSEDFSVYGEAGVRLMMFRIGATSQATLDEAAKTGIPVPSLHSAKFAPEREPTIKATATAEVLALRELMPAAGGHAGSAR